MPVNFLFDYIAKRTLQNYTDKVLSPRRLERSVDDITIPWLRPNNHPQPITISNSERYDITCLVFIKSYKTRDFRPPKSVLEANAWRTHYPFWNTTDIKRVVWSKFFNEVTLQDAKRIVAREVCDTLYTYIYQNHIPITGVKVVLFNGTLDETVSPRVLRDPWFDSVGFNGLKIDRRRLNAWGIKSGYARIQQDVRKSVFKPQVFDLVNLRATNIEARLKAVNINLNQILKESALQTEEQLTRIENRNQRYKIQSKLRSLVSGLHFKTLFCGFLYKKLQGRSFQREFMEASDQRALVQALVQQIVNDFVDKEIQNLR